MTNLTDAFGKSEVAYPNSAPGPYSQFLVKPWPFMCYLVYARIHLAYLWLFMQSGFFWSSCYPRILDILFLVLIMVSLFLPQLKKQNLNGKISKFINNYSTNFFYYLVQYVREQVLKKIYDLESDRKIGTRQYLYIRLSVCVLRLSQATIAFHYFYCFMYLDTTEWCLRN